MQAVRKRMQRKNKIQQTFVKLSGEWHWQWRWSLRRKRPKKRRRGVAKYVNKRCCWHNPRNRRNGRNVRNGGNGGNGCNGRKCRSFRRPSVQRVRIVDILKKQSIKRQNSHPHKLHRMRFVGALRSRASISCEPRGGNPRSITGGGKFNCFHRLNEKQ